MTEKWATFRFFSSHLISSHVLVGILLSNSMSVFEQTRSMSKKLDIATRKSFKSSAKKLLEKLNERIKNTGKLRHEESCYKNSAFENGL